jgi:hypothetical protein
MPDMLPQSPLGLDFGRLWTTCSSAVGGMFNVSRAAIYQAEQRVGITT